MPTNHVQVALAVTPRLLSEALVLLLTGAGLDVIDVTDDGPAENNSRFSVLVTSERPRRDAPASLDRNTGPSARSRSTALLATMYETLQG